MNSLLPVLYKATPWINALILIIGLAVAAWGYRVSRKAGYWIVATYFFLAACNLTLGPAINGAFAKHRQPTTQLSPEDQKAYAHDLVALTAKYYPQGPPKGKIRIPFPFGSIILVAGLWLLVRHEQRARPSPTPTAQ